MAGTITLHKTSTPISAARSATGERPWARVALIATALSFLGLFLLVPLIAVFAEAFRKGVDAYFAGFSDPAAMSAIWLTLLVTVIAVPLNIVFGLAASWAIAKFEFRGKSVLITLIDLPFAVSPVISGLVYVLMFGMQGWMGPWLAAHNLQIIFAVPGHRAGDPVRHVPVRGPRADPADAGAGHRGRAGGDDVGGELGGRCSSGSRCPT